MVLAPISVPRLALVYAASAMFAIGVCAQAHALETVVLDNVKIDNGKGSTAIPHVEFVGTNLTKDEVQKLFASGTSEADAMSLLGKLIASRITIPEATATAPEGKMTVKAFQATDVDTGKVGHITIGGFEGGFSDASGPAMLKSGPIALDGAGFTGIFSALKSGKLGDATTHFGHFSWQGLEVSGPDKETPASAPGGNLVKVWLESVTIDGTADGDVPLKTAGAIKGLKIELPKASEAGKSLADNGYPALNLGMTFSSTYDPAKNALTIDDLTINGVDAGSLGLKLTLGGVDKKLFTGNQNDRVAALLAGNIATAEIHFANAGVSEKVLAYAAASQGKTPDALKAEASAMAAQMIPILLNGHPVSTGIAAEVTKFIANPKGLTIAARPKSGALGFFDAISLTTPAAFLEKIDVTVLAQAAGSLPPPAAPASPPAAAAAPAPSPPAAAQAPAAPRRLTGAAAWNALIGNTISGKNDDGEPYFEFYLANGTVKQLDDDDTATGKWALRGDRICFEYPDDDEESCYKLVVEGNIATFTDDDDAGKRYEILKGNAKRL